VTVGTPAVSDALDALGVGGVIDGLQRVATTRDVVIGRARVAQVVDSTDEGIPGLGPLLDSVERGDVLVLGWESEATASTLGDLACHRIARRGAVGFVSEGWVRDVASLETSGLAIWARGTTPRSGKRRLAIREVAEVVLRGGVVVRAGDLVAADSTGVCVIPQSHAEVVLKLAEDNENRDARSLAGLEGGSDFADVMP
jgi:4-hydroxy-4-methyl-2-oxoglutarate aldolase